VSYETILLETDGPVAVLTLNRPDKLNALNATVRREVMEAVDALGDDDDVKVVILTGAGEKAFIAGADVEEFADRSPAEQREVYQHRRVYEAVAEFPKPILAAIHGYCLGGGSELALACDLRIADRTARFGQAEIRIGLVPGAGGTVSLPRRIGRHRTAELALRGAAIGASDARRWGLVDAVEP
jgi:enoyl-CoA hydratase